ncbi:MAG TPA: ATP-binding protein [Oceanipulchritudo sp.]|nr:ATP-binding protein [Oceanipulchritudo sp.]
MAASPDKFYGREEDLTWLRRHIFGWGEEERGTPILLLHGEPGAGKTALVRHFLDAYTGPGGSLRTANFIWNGTNRTGPPQHFASLLLEGMETSLAELENRKKRLVLAPGNEPAGGVPETEDPASDTYTIHGEPRETGFLPIRQGREYELSLQFIETLKDWLGPPMRGGSLELDALFRLIFIFDRFESYTIPVKKWLGGHLFPAMVAAPSLPRIAILLTGTKPWESSGQADYWDAHPGAFRQREVGPLPRHVCEDWLEDVGLRSSLLDLLYEETEGYPGRILEALEDVEELKRKHRSNFDPEDPLGSFTPQQRRWLHALAMNREINLETIQVLLGRVEGLQAFGWASRNVGFCQVETDDNGDHFISLNDPMREAVLRQTIEKMPSRHREFLEKVAMITTVREKVNSEDHRSKLRTLTPLQPFNYKLIEAVFEKHA